MRPWPAAGDEGAVTRGLHRRQEAMREFGDRGHHHLQEVGMRFPVRGQVAAGDAVTGVVDQVRYPQAAPVDFLLQSARRGRVGEVGDDAFDRHLRTQRRRECFQSIAPARGQDQRHAAPGVFA